MDGILLVNKPLGVTSFDVVREVRKKYNTKKVGHIGTLDPMASGVLPILIGKATKLSNLLMDHDKDYTAIICLGTQTDTGDQEGKIIKKSEVAKLSTAQINKVLNNFIGESYQTPPMYSAIKINGEKLYNLARQGKIVERPSRKIKITHIKLLDFSNNQIKFTVTCSKGTYIRVLCEDISTQLGTCGYMSSLTRTRVGNFKIEDITTAPANNNNSIFISNSNFINSNDLYKKVFFNLPNIHIPKTDESKLLNGVSIPLNRCLTNFTNKKTNPIPGVSTNSNYPDNEICNLFIENQYIGIGEILNNYCKRKIILC